MAKYTEAIKDHRPDELVLFVGSGEWSALYSKTTDELIDVGDTPLIFERLVEALGVAMEWNEDFMVGLGDKREDVASTLTQLLVHRDERTVRLREAQRLRSEAEELMVRAQELEKAR